MSASLVGSEMCIRDRGQGGRHDGPSGKPKGQRPEQGPPTARANAEGRPVSYTHLTLPTICSV
eukprot:1740791-Alexandrium_andersonii.AAC.1